MLVSNFHFSLPKEFIADAPMRPRDAARLLQVTSPYQDKHIYDLPDLLNPHDILVFNDTKVLPVRLQVIQGGRHVEVTLHKQLEGNCWKAFAKPARKLHVGSVAEIGEGFSAVVLEKQGGEVILEFSVGGSLFFEKLLAHGIMPLPPYIKRGREGLKEDFDDYQTVFAKHEGAVAAPTAGLHFTDRLLKAIDDKGIASTYVTLHVGAGTFLPVKVEDTKDHVMHTEYGMVSQDACSKIREAKEKGGKVVAVGTTALRALESAARQQKTIQPFAGETNLFITPGYQFNVVDKLLTNFHLPGSTLFMLVSAFSGLTEMKQAYAYAMEQRYRFYSFGDACFLERKRP
jgi:S-adenosylmethionine:tRNA ribosyltransferase-isomerase